MSLMSNLYKMGSGLKVAQRALYTTSHNMANSETQGYSRQRITQSDSSYRTVGANGNTLQRVGMGVDINETQQIRDKLLDRTYRQSSSKIQYYVAKENTISEIETILGEISGETLGYQMDNLWKSLNTLSTHPEGIETRTSFLQTAVKFIDKSNEIYNKIVKHQYELNDQIKSTVKEINETAEEIARYNELIAKYEACGDNANDYRDQRNLLIDKLSTYGDINVKEDQSGQVSINFEGCSIVHQRDVQRLGLQYENGDGLSFVKPVWTNKTSILAHNEDVTPLYNKSNLQNISAEAKTDRGFLKGLLVSRGDVIGDRNTPDSDIKGSLIPTIQKELDILVNSITGMFNSIVTGNTSTGAPPYDLYGNNANNLPIFTTIDGTNNFVAGNIKVNQELLLNPSKLALSVNIGEPGDNTLIEEALKRWKDDNGQFSPQSPAVGHKQNFDTYYAQFIARIGDSGSVATNMINNETMVLNKIENTKQSISGVSLDEEMANMIMYQHAYNASAKVYNVIDSMLDTIINRM